MSMNNYNNNQNPDWDNAIPVGSGLPYAQNPQNPQNPQYGAPQNPQYGAPVNPQNAVPQPVILEQETDEQFQMPQVEEKKGHGWLIALIAIVAALIVALAVTLIILLTGKRGASDESTLPGSSQTTAEGAAIGNRAVQSYAMYEQYETAIGSLLIDGKQITLPRKALSVNDTVYVSLQDFASVFGYFTEINPRDCLAVISKDNQRFVFAAGMPNATRINSNVQETVTLEGEPILFDNNQMYVVLQSLKPVFNFQSVEWNGESAGIVIVTDGTTVPVRTVVEETEPNLSLDSLGGAAPAVPPQTEDAPPLPDNGTEQTQPQPSAPTAPEEKPSAPEEKPSSTEEAPSKTPAAPSQTEQPPYPGYSNLPDISGERSNLPQPRGDSPIGGMAMPQQ